MRVEKPCRVSRSFTQHLCAPAGDVFPLLCPVRETEWVNDWRPKKVISESGVAEPGCIFVTPGIPEDALWLMTVHDPIEHRLEIIKIIPGVVIGTITVEFSSDGDSASTADITYAYTALSDHGQRALPFQPDAAGGGPTLVSPGVFDLSTDGVFGCLKC